LGGSGNINEASQSPRPLVWLLIKSPNFRYVEAGGAGVSRERVCLRARTCLPIFSTWHLIPFLAGDCHQYLSSDRDGNISNETFSWMDEIVTNTTSLPFSHAGVQKDMIIKILESIDSRSARNPDEGRDKSLSRNGDIAMCCASTCWSDEHQTAISLRTQIGLGTSASNGGFPRLLSHRALVATAGTFGEVDIVACDRGLLLSLTGRNHDTQGCPHQDSALANLSISDAQRLSGLPKEAIAASEDSDPRQPRLRSDSALGAAGGRRRGRLA
jgi:hypothetical protein